MIVLTTPGFITRGAAESLADVEAQNPQKVADTILDQGKNSGGLIVHLGCGDGRLTVALGANENTLVHGLSDSSIDVDKARRHLQMEQLYGKVSVDTFDGKHLPYVDNLINLLVISVAYDVGQEEMQRVLAPGGHIVFLRPSSSTPLVSQKPWPTHIDQWTHFLHDSSNNAVADDRVVGPPRSLQWVAEPRWGRHHDGLASVSAMVSADGRLFSLVDEGPVTLVHESARWSLVARDAFNGILLWKRAFPSWQSHLRRFRSGPPELPRRLVAVGDRVYVTLGYGAAVSVLDARTGKTLQTYDGTEGTREIVFADNVLYLLAGDEMELPLAVRRSSGNQTPPVSHVVAVNATTGRVLWKRQCLTPVLPLTLAVSGQRLFYQDTEELQCLDARSGKRHWRAPCRATLETGGWAAPTLVVHQDVVLSSDRQRVVAMDVNDGRALWNAQAAEGFKSPGDVFVIDDQVWVWRYDHPGGKADWRTVDRAADATGYYDARDLRTGALRRSLHMSEIWTDGHHHRCYRNKATSQFLFIGKRGVELVDLSGENHSRNNWARGVCQYGILPCNGLLYVPPHACKCSIQAQLNGFYALAPEGRSTVEQEQDPRDRLEKGPAYGDLIQNANSTIESRNAWPTYRYSPTRSGATEARVASDLTPAWRVEIGGKISQPVMAGNRLYVARADTHTVHALDAEDGQTLWTFTAGGSIDSPPTIHAGRVLFGSQDGWVYCLRATDGVMLWRFLAAPSDLRTIACGELSSVWPVHGSVLVRETAQGPRVYFAAGRSGHLDGGIWVYALDPETGKLCHSNQVSMPHPRGSERTDLASSHSMPGAFSDVLVSHGHDICMRHIQLDQLCVQQEDAPSGALVAQSGLLDDDAFYRSPWQLGRIQGQMLVFDEHSAYGVRTGYQVQPWMAQARSRHQNFESYRAADFPRGSLVFAASTAAKSEGQAAPAWALPASSRKAETCRWFERIPMQVRAMLLCQERTSRRATLFVAGWRDTLESGYVVSDALLQAIDAKTGQHLAEIPLPAPPVFDGLIAVDHSLYLAMQDGTLMRLGEEAVTPSRNR